MQVALKAAFLLRSHQASQQTNFGRVLDQPGFPASIPALFQIFVPLLPRFQVIEIEAISRFVQKATFSRAKSLKASVA